MIQIDLKSIATKLITTFNEAGELSVKLQKEGLKITIKEDNSPVTNGDIAVNDIITKKTFKILRKGTTYFKKLHALHVAVKKWK